MVDIPGDEKRTGSRKGGSHIVDAQGNEKIEKPVAKTSRRRSSQQDETEKDSEGGEE